MREDEQPAFGELLRSHRLALGLSQEQLAERAGLTAQAVSALERGFRRAPYRDTVRDLARALELTRADTATLEASVSRARQPGTALHEPLPAQLPEPASPLIGREREAAEIQASLRRDANGRSVRLLTLLGPGGVGKTRLALHVAAAVAHHYSGGVVFVPLAALQDPRLVASALAQALQVPESAHSGPLEATKRRLRQASALLVFDNFEHVLDAADLVADLLSACPHIQFLVTSRARLHLSGEHVYLVAPLGLPDVNAPGDVSNAPAVALLIERARAAGASTDFDAPALHALSAICRQLDGLPLAIELAAPRLRVLSPEVLLERLREPFVLLTQGARDLPERQRTLRAALDWSYDLLEPDARAVLRRLSVMSGSCSLETVEAVCAAGEQDPTRREMVDSVGTLLDQRLLRAQTGPDTGQRFAMLEIVRAYAFERLVESGEVDRVQHAFVRHFVELVERAQQELNGPRQAEQLARLDVERDNVRGALSWSMEHDPALAQRLAAGLREYWLARGLLTEGREWLRRSLDMPSIDAGIEAALATGAALLALEQADIDEADRLANRAFARARTIGNARQVVDALNAAGLIARTRGDYALANNLHAEALEHAQAAGDRARVGKTLANLGWIASLSGDAARAAGLYEHSLQVARELGDIRTVAEMLVALAWQSFHRADFERTKTLGTEALASLRVLGHAGRIAEVLWLLALVAQQEEEFDRATALHAESLDLRRTRGDELGVAQSLSAMAQIALRQRDVSAARDLLTQALDVLDHRESQWPRAMAMTLMGHVELADGNAAAARTALLDGFRTFTTIGNPLYVPWSLEGTACVAAMEDRPKDAARLLGAGEALRERLGSSLHPVDPMTLAEAVRGVRASLGEPDYAAAFQAGRGLSPADVMQAYARELPGRG